ncbi:DUF924 domain-containing protein [Rhodobacteraceae bacterium NNCM2]|nr:DUF924 domain-containing protein [Coraliihabitans acroporae]
MPDDPRANAILTYWHDEVGPAGWYEADPARDGEIASRFRDDWHVAMTGGHREWMRAARPALALIVLTDQFSRNIFRGSGQAYAADPMALRAANTAIRMGYDKVVANPLRQFFYLPFMHSERLSDQERCVRLFLLDPDGAAGDNLDHAVKHREVIRRFGRFPSRNAALGRKDSPHERAYREAGGYMS